jgi:hypothetical protein
MSNAIRVFFSGYFKAQWVKVHTSLLALRENEDNEPLIRWLIGNDI